MVDENQQIESNINKGEISNLKKEEKQTSYYTNSNSSICKLWRNYGILQRT